MEKAETFEALESLLSKVREAQKIYTQYSQEQVDAIFHNAAQVATANRIPLAKLAVEETGMGLLEDKVIKNHFASEYIYNQYKNTLTCGLIEDDPVSGFRKIAAPLGLVAGIIPTTNPTSTTIFKALLCLKTRNAIIFSPHPRAKNCTMAAAKLIAKAAEEAGAPANLVACLENPSLEQTQRLMSEVNLVLATGGPGMVKAAYSSGVPAIGVGAGNTPVVIDATADLKMAVNSILLSKTFDYGLICASEQTILAEASIAEELKAEFILRGAYFTNSEETEQLANVLFTNGSLNNAIVGQPAAKIAELAGFSVPNGTKVLVAERAEIKASDPFAHEKLSPVLGFYRLPDFASAVENAQKLVVMGGAGHTSVLYTHESNTEHMRLFEQTLTTGRVLINMPASQGAIGDVYNFKISPSLTLGCGSWGGNSVSENIGVKHLMNVKSVAVRRENMLWYRVPPKIYFKLGSLEPALSEYKDRHRACVITDKTMVSLGHAERVSAILSKLGLEVRIFSDVNPDPDLATAEKAMLLVNSFQPDLFVALGGGSPMDAAKIIWLLYEVPNVKFNEIALRFMDIRKRVVTFPDLGKKAKFVAIPTTSGTGSEVTPFAVITDNKTGVKYPVADYALTPDMAIVDPALVMDLPKALIANAGLDVLTHGLEAYTSTMATNFADAHALEAIRLIFKYLKRSYNGGPERQIPREKVHYAATMAGMAFANAFLGVCHSMAHAMGSFLHLPHGLANALLLSYVIEYNATDTPTKQGMMPQYKYPWVKGRYARVADLLHLADDLEGDTSSVRSAKTARLVQAIEELKKAVGIPASIREAG
ncbi:MAG: bifunctional acetaldehyde-CoA/alcohol dehydrogenase, partial [Desulfovibrio sp.]|nr:bifunctional acetaldehyde-CoA/alcohol dehydrogenase [Desulfovibrio sp.]